MSKQKYSNNYLDIIEKYKSFHSKGAKKLSPSQTFAGYSLVKWVANLKKIIEDNNCKSLIDYGCGKAMLYNNSITIDKIKYKNITDYWNIQNIYLYNPAVIIYSKNLTKNADGVVFADVIKHILEEDIMIFINDIFKPANKFIVIVIATKPASKYFEDGRNIYICLKSQDEWLTVFQKFKKQYPDINQYFFFNE